MSRKAFVWEVQIRREVLDDEMARLRELPYSVWRRVIDNPIRRDVKARDARLYRLTVSARFVHGDAGDIEVALSLSRTGLMRRRIMRQNFVITPENVFRV